MKIIIQYEAINPKYGKLQHFLKEVTYQKYYSLYVPASLNGTIKNLTILK